MKKIVFLLFFVVLFLPFTLFAQINLEPSGARPIAMGNAYVSQGGVWSISHNQAGLTSLGKSTFAVSHQNKFAVDQLSTNSILLALPSKIGCFGFDFHRLGWTKWNESNSKFSFARSFGQSVSASLSFSVYTSRIAVEDVNLRAMGAQMGIIYHYSNKTSFGFHLTDPFKFGDSVEQIVTIARLGGHSYLSNTFLLTYELAKYQYEKNLDVRMGFEWLASHNFKVRSGISTVPYLFSAGIGYLFDFLEADLSFSYHQYLGLTPSISVAVHRP